MQFNRLSTILVRYQLSWGGGRDKVCFIGNHTDSKLLISTLEDVIRVIVGDWIIRGVKEELYPCKLDIFEQTYEEVSQRYLTTVALRWRAWIEMIMLEILLRKYSKKYRKYIKKLRKEKHNE